jgi:hypothetical protein
MSLGMIGMIVMHRCLNELFLDVLHGLHELRGFSQGERMLSAC